jgi:hypothetical protein
MKRIGFIKDIAAGAVFFAGITAIIGLIIYVPFFFRHSTQSRMAKTIKKEPLDKKNNSKGKSWVLTKQHKIALGSLLSYFLLLY